MKKVLIIDDTEETRDLLYMAVVVAGFFPLCAEDGKRGFDMAKKESPHLIITDMVMPIQDGFTMLKQLKNDAQISSIPVIVITTKAKLEEFLKNDPGVKIEHFFEKPFEVDMLVKKIKEILL